jgi:putative phosphoesterase
MEIGSTVAGSTREGARVMTERFERMARVGLIADTHDEKVEWATLQPAVARAFEGVGLVLLCGDLQTLRVLDQLEAMAPVRAVRGDTDPPAQPPRLVDGPLVVETGDTRIAVFRAEPDTGDAGVSDAHVVVYGSTHEAVAKVVNDAIFVNPGSPSLAATRCVAVLELGGARPAVTLVPLPR